MKGIFRHHIIHIHIYIYISKTSKWILPPHVGAPIFHPAELVPKGVPSTAGKWAGAHAECESTLLIIFFRKSTKHLSCSAQL